MTQLDLLVLIGITLLLLVIGLSGTSRNTTTQEFFLAGRNLRWWQIGFSLFSTNFSASTIIGLTGAAYITGIAIYNYEWVGVLAMIFFAVVLVGTVRKSNIYTISQYLEERYDSRVKVAYSAFIIFLITFIEMAGALYAGGMLLQEVFPLVSINVIIIALMVLAATYAILGGLTAISRTDVLQTVVIIIGAVLVSYYTFQAAGGLQQVIADAPPDAFKLVLGLDNRAVPWTGLITGIPVLCIYFWLTNQNMVQWVLSARSEGDAYKGLLMAGYLKLLVLFIIIIPGVAAINLFPNLTEPDSLYPTLLFELLPTGVLGLVLAGFVAAIMSTTDSTLHAASTIITMDFIKKIRPNLSVGGLVWSSRITTITIILISAVWAPMIGRFGTLFEYVQGLLSFAVAPFVVVYLAGWFWHRANTSGAILALIFGISGALVVGWLNNTEVIDIHYLYVPLPIAVLSMIGMVVGTYLSPAPTCDSHLQLQQINRPSTSELIWTGGLLFLIALQVIWFF